MNLSPGQEDQMLRSCEKLIWSIVHQFRRRNTKAQCACMEDLFQEASIVMLEHIRRSPDEATARKAPILDMTNAMCRYLMEMSVVHIPKRTTDFRKTFVYAANIPAPPRSLLCCAPAEEDAETYADFDAFLSSLPAREQILVRHKLAGQTNRDAGRAAGMGDATAMRALRRVRKKYEAFVA